jgi:hypothetical protein
VIDAYWQFHVITEDCINCQPLEGLDVNSMYLRGLAAVNEGGRGRGLLAPLLCSSRDKA